MASISSKWRVWALALALAPLLAQPVQAKYVSVIWNTTLYKNIKCVKIKNEPFDNDASARSFGVNPTHGELKTKYTAKNNFMVLLYTRANCQNATNSGARVAKSFSLIEKTPNHKDISVGSKYVYAYFL